LKLINIKIQTSFYFHRSKNETYTIEERCEALYFLYIVLLAETKSQSSFSTTYIASFAPSFIPYLLKSNMAAANGHDNVKLPI